MEKLIFLSAPANKKHFADPNDLDSKQIYDLEYAYLTNACLGYSLAPIHAAN